MSLGRFIRGSLPPVGEPIVFKGARGADFPANRSVQLLNSGTAALALALLIAARSREAGTGEVILPAYGCPDLIAAADHAGLVPVLVDIQGHSPRYQLDALRAAIKDSTVAIVAVNFLGIHENLDALRELIADKSIVLIEDNAQYFPVDGDGAAFGGDLVVLSFGRGKPISQLGGGALLAGQAFAGDLAELAAGLPGEQRSERQWRLKAHIFNLVLRPQIYQLLLMLPFLHIGETRYHALEQICRMAPWRAHYLAVNIAAYRSRVRRAQDAIDTILQEFDGDLINLPRAHGCQQLPLLRYPILCTSDTQAAALYTSLAKEGLGVSRMYEKPLPEIAGVPHHFGTGYKGAAEFSGRLLTLPVTSLVDDTRLERLARCMRSVL